MRDFRTRVISILTLATFALSLAPLPAPAASNPSLAQAAPAAAKVGTLSGKVIDGRNSPIAGANIRVEGPARRTGVSAQDGSFSFTLPEGVYDIIVDKAGFQTTESDGFGIAAGIGSSVTVTMTETSVSTLRTIGRIQSARTGTFNTSASAVTTLGGEVLAERQNENINGVIRELPGINIQRTFSTTPNTNFVIRGAAVETKVMIDGHVLSNGSNGTWNSNYANSLAFGSVEVVKGAGLNGPNAGESVFGTVNLRTRDFTRTNTADLLAGLDSFGGSFYSLYSSVNLLKDNKLSILAGKNFTGFRGANDSYTAPRYDSTAPGIIDFLADFSNRFSLESENVKFRYRFSDATSLQAGYLGLQGQYYPQGGGYGSYLGQTVIQPCYPTTKPCDYSSKYNAPNATQLIGQTTPIFAWFPGSTVQNNEPYYSAELRTTFKNDTILLRPYAALINRFIDGSHEGQTAGYNGWFLVTNPGNCQPTFSGPATTGPNAGTAAGGAKGPCFQNGVTVPYIGPGPMPPTVLTTTTTPLPCSVTSPCYTTSTAIDNGGRIAFTGPFSQNEIDNLHGGTFSYIHPVHENVYNFSYDYSSDAATFYTADNTPIPSGCSYYLSRFTPADPGCSLPFNPSSPYGTPTTLERKNDFALTGTWQLKPQLQLSLGNYLSAWKLTSQIEDPATFAQLSTKSPLKLVTVTNARTHYDPHLALTWRPSINAIYRASAGSAVTWPYAFQVSGLSTLSLPNAANGNVGSVNLKNPNLQPETSVAYDLGTDFQTGMGLVSLDLFHVTIHNVFLTNQQPYTGPPIQGGAAGATYLQTSVLNGPIERNYGIELSIAKKPPLGFGYQFSATLQRAYADQLPASLYANQQSALINGKQLDGTPAIVPFAKGYGEIRYAGVNNFLFTLGADWEGANNETFGPGFIEWNSTTRIGLGKNLTFQMAVQNLTNVNTAGTFIGAAYASGPPAYPNLGGFRQVIYGSPGAGAPPVFSSLATPLHVTPSRTFRFSLQRSFGR